MVRLFQAARRGLGLALEPRPTRRAASLGRQNRLIQQALLELDAVMKLGHSQRLEYLLGLMHLSYVFLDGAPGNTLHEKLRPVLKQIYNLGQNDLASPTQSSSPLAYFVSYPRSGNTLVTRLAAKATEGQIFSAMSDGFSPFSKRIYPKAYPLPRVIKDHQAHQHYENDRCIFIIRDGRDTMASLAFMTSQQGHHKFRMKGEMASFIRWTANSYAFGSWAAHMRDVMKLTGGPEKLVVRYEDITTDKDFFFKIVDFFDPENKLPRDHLAEVFAARDAVVDSIKSKPHVNDQWGFGYTFEPESMFYEWSLNRKGSSWRQAWDHAAKRAFHETGATEALIEFGYEKDPNWWRS